MNYRVHLQHEFTLLGLDEYIEVTNPIVLLLIVHIDDICMLVLCLKVFTNNTVYIKRDVVSNEDTFIKSGCTKCIKWFTLFLLYLVVLVLIVESPFLV